MPENVTAPVLHAHNLADAVRRHAHDRPSATAFVERGGAERVVVGWAEFDEMVDQSAAALDGLGLVAGQRVGIQMTNSVEALSVWFAALRTGVVAVPLNPRLTERELDRKLTLVGAPLLLTDLDVAVPDGVRRVPLTGLREGVRPTRVESPPDPEALAAIVFTSGTSGQSRGAMFTQRALMAHCRHAIEGQTADDTDVALAMLPLCHLYGLNAIVGVAVQVGAATVLVEGMVPDLCEVLAEEGVTQLPVTPSVLYRLLQDPELPRALDTLRVVSSGAAPMPSVLGERFTATTGLRVEQGYGQTEAAPGISTTIGGPVLGPGHVGRPLPGVEVRIGDGTLGGDPGEVHVRGDNLFSGYWPDGSGGPDEDGWRATGDVGYVQNRELFLLDRAGELIIVSGFNVYPSEIEEVLEQHDSVRGAAVIGAPDERTGEKVVAFVEGRVKLREVRALAAEQLARYKVPSEFIVLKSIPRTSTGKPRKGVLRDMLDTMEEEGDA